MDTALGEPEGRMTQARVAVLGLGGMGAPMAANILRAGLPTVVWNRSPEPARRLGDQGAEVAGSPADAVRRADLVITMVTDADAVRSIATDQGMLAAMAEGAVWAQMSTIGVTETERLVRLVAGERPDVVLVDAPGGRQPGPGRAGPARRPGLRAGAGPGPGRAGLRRGGPAYGLGRAGRGRVPAEAGQQPAARLRGRRARGGGRVR